MIICQPWQELQSIIRILVEEHLFYVLPGEEGTFIPHVPCTTSRETNSFLLFLPGVVHLRKNTQTDGVRTN